MIKRRLISVFAMIFLVICMMNGPEIYVNVEKGIVGKVYSNRQEYNDILINYPQLHGIIKGGQEGRINKLIEEDVLGVLEKEKAFEENNLWMHLDYEIKFLNENVISIFYEGKCGAIYNCGNFQPICVSTTIDIQQEKVLTLKEIIIDLDALSVLLHEDNFKDITTPEGLTGFRKISNRKVSNEKLLELLEKDEYDNESNYIQWYTDGENLVIDYCYAYYEEYAISVQLIESIMNADFVNSIKGENQINKKEATINNMIEYNVPVQEIKEIIEYQYIYDNMIYDVSSYDFKELGVLPVGESVPVTIYVAEGNKILFLPREKENAEILINGEFCSGYYSEQYQGYLFYVLKDWMIEEEGVPVNSLEDHDDIKIDSCIVRKDEEFIETKEMTQYGYEYYLDDIVKLGEIEVNFNPDKKMDLPVISIEGNEYIDSLLESIKDILKERGKLGTYEMFVETYGRYWYKYGGSSSCKITGCVMGEDVKQWFIFEISDCREIAYAFPTWYPMVEDSPTYFVFEQDLDKKPEDIFRRVVELRRESVSFSATEEKQFELSEQVDRLDYSGQSEFVSGMSLEDAIRWINYVCSYSEWFGMNELGYQEGEIRGLRGKEIIIYDGYRELYFIPKAKINCWIKGKDGKIMPVYENEDGEIEFYGIHLNPAADGEAQLKTSLFVTDRISVCYAEDMIRMIGEATLEIDELSMMEIPKVEADEYVLALENYIEDLLAKNENEGKYNIYLGEYEAFSKTKVCLSAAVTGEEEYYVRYLIVKSQKGNYYFWPVGFGLDGSLEECAAEQHYMNKVCIERTKQLERYVSEIEVE